MRKCISIRRGKIVVMAALLMTGILFMIAFAVDIGYILIARSDLQRSADAAAHAAAMRYASNEETYAVHASVRAAAKEYVGRNFVLRDPVDVTLNADNESDGDIVLGKLDFNDPDAELTFGNPDEYNAVRVRVRRTSEQNGVVPMFIARIFGRDSVEVEAFATAAMKRSVSGFRIPQGEQYMPVIPITVHDDYWDETIYAAENDEYSFNEDGTVTFEPDGVPEVLLYPDRTTSGNFGTINIGESNNSTDHLSDQIRNGLSEADLVEYGGEFKLDDYGELDLNADPGLSAAVKDDLRLIIGTPRIIPLYGKINGEDVVYDEGDNSTGNGNGGDNGPGGGNNSIYTIVRFVGVRVMYTRLNGGNKRVVMQPTNVSVRGTIYSETSGTSETIFSPAVLVK